MDNYLISLSFYIFHLMICMIFKILYRLMSGPQILQHSKMNWAVWSTIIEIGLLTFTMNICWKISSFNFQDVF